MTRLHRLAFTFVLAWPLPLPAQPGLAARIDPIFAGHARAGAPGCAVGVARAGEPLFSKGYGTAVLEEGRPITAGTGFNLGSVAKQFTAFAALMLEQRGRLSLDDDVRRYVPELPQYGMPIRVRDLLYHTSGLRDYGTLEILGDRRIVTVDEFLALIALQRGLNFATGTRHEYSHTDYELLGVVIERAVKEPLGDFLAREIWMPLGMTSTRLHDARGLAIPGRAFAYVGSGDNLRMRFPDNELVGGSNVYTTVDDLLRWERNFHDARVGGREVVDRMRSRPALASGETIPYAYGLMLGQYRGLHTVYRGGSGGDFQSSMLQFPGEQLAVYTLCNVSTAHAFGLGEEVAELFLEDRMTPVETEVAADTVATPPDEVARYAGIYQPTDEPWNLMRITARDGTLYDEVAHESFRMVRLRDGRYHDSGVFYTFTSSNGTVHLRVADSRGDQLFVKVPPGAFWSPDARMLATYSGTFYSSDVRDAWTVVRAGGQLALQRAGRADEPLMPIAPDLFMADIGAAGHMLPIGIRFERGNGAGVEAFTVTALPTYEVVRDLRFDRIRP